MKILFEGRNITKMFGPTVALNQVNLTIYRGEIHGLIGENGSGKSTISSIAAGMQKATSGEMFFKGSPYNPSTMIEGSAAGFGMIVQEMGTVSGITIAQNIFLGNEDKFRKLGLINAKAMNKAAKEALDRIGFTDVDPSAYIDTLDMQDRKLVEIAKVMYNNPEVLVVDETTTALSQKGRDIIYQIMKKMKEDNKSVIFISHDLEETISQCDKITILRDGLFISTLNKPEFEENKIKKLLVGRDMGDRYYREDNDSKFEDEVILDIHNLTTGHGLLMNFSAQLHKGEILGIGGLSHCGMHELGRAIFGEETVVTGYVKHVPSGDEIKNARIAIKHGMGYVSKNRDTEALVLTASIRDNVIGSAYDKVTKGNILITPGAEKKYVNKQIESLRIKCASMDQDVQYLSGGNKQKVVFAKWIGRESKILILDCPTRGVDISVKSAMYQLMEEIKKEGGSILLISEELPELIGMSDRLIILKDGIISGELTRGSDFNENSAIEYMI